MFTFPQIWVQFGNIEINFSQIKIPFDYHGAQHKGGIAVVSFQWYEVRVLVRIGGIHCKYLFFFNGTLLSTQLSTHNYCICSAIYYYQHGWFSQRLPSLSS